jgi:hypothetical protein
LIIVIIIIIIIIIALNGICNPLSALQSAKDLEEATIKDDLETKQKVDADAFTELNVEASKDLEMLRASIGDLETAGIILEI